ncbi:MAG: hypothetical protein PHG65_07730 [Kiritimatiellae bacterium]|nr:hypothetical protein [Kiritimatiellia bacterium]
MNPFAQCSMCKTSWDTREQFISDPETEIIGYQPDFDNLLQGLLYFNHNKTGCGTTLSFNVHQFSDIYSGPIYTEHKTGGAECPGFCLHEGNLEPCPAYCACAYVREVLQILRQYNKNKSP